ncbi:energy transducer TonB [Vibrio sp. M260118]|uniref:energy transducer TonB n=1 Tax=Vibrio sp. M260118 TaxID=3020896 RepID=UPI002F3EA39D
MNVKRYTIAGSISLAIHAAFVFIAQEPKAFAMPAGAQSNTVSINFKTMAPPSASPAEQAVTKPEPVPETKPKETQPEPKQVVKKTKPVEKKVTKKKPNVEKKITKAKPVVHNKPTTETPKEKLEQKVAETKQITQQESPAQPKLVNQGASSQPVMVTQPSFLSRPTAPKYPRLARKRGVEGTAIYEIWLDENGDQVRQVLISSSGATMLDKSALEAIKKWRFSPHSINGQTMAHRVQIPVRFNLDR